jgi:hypothetical protein
MERIDVYFGAVVGPAFRIYDGGEVGVFAGLGPDISCTVHLNGFGNDSFDSTETLLGIGLGGALETRLRMHKDFSFTGGILMRYDFSGPYIGIGF